MALDDLKPLIEAGNQTIAAIRAEVDGMKSQDVVSAEKLARMEADLAATLSAKQAEELARKALEKRLADLEAKAGRPGNFGAPQDAGEHKAAFLDYMRKGENGGAGQRLFDLQAKAADVRVGTAGSGGYALPKELAAAVLKLAQDVSPIRSIANVVQVGTTDYHEVVSGAGFTTEWVGEVAERATTETPNFFDVAPTFGELSAKPEITRHSANDLFFDVEAWLMAEAAERFAAAEGAAFVSGNGTNKPTGFLAGPTPVATADATRAFGTLQYVATGQAAALATNAFDTFKTVRFGLKQGYQQNARFVMNSLTLAALAVVKDSTGQYLLTPAVREGESDMISGKPVTVAEDMPNIGAGAFPVAFGDFQKGYTIADVVGMWMIRDELTKPGWIRFPMHKRVGGKLRDTQAIKLIKIAAS
jgi:HK97 family phage major capsid protein